MIAVAERPLRPVVLAALVLIGALIGFAPHALAAWRNDVDRWDERLSVTIHAAENRDTILNRYVDVLGAPLHPAVTIIGVAAVLGVAAVRMLRGEHRLGLAVVVGLIGAVLLVPLLKGVFARPPVDPGGKDGYSFPSGHAARSAVVGLLLSSVAWPTRWRWAVAFGTGAVVVLVGIGVVYHEWHWASDVLGGWALAIAWLATVWLAFRPSLTWAGTRP